jgi:hypothetical protein
MRQHLTLFANFICKFGDVNLADMLADIVLPAFTDDTLVRQAYGSSFYLLDVELVRSLAPDVLEPAIVGQFVRDTFLRREQVFNAEQGALVADEAALQTSPSAFFVLLLRDHRLVYFAETKHAPDLKTFATTMEGFITRKYHSYIDKVYENYKHDGGRVTKKALREELPPPALEVVPLTSSDELKEFVARYHKLQRVDITVHRKNDEISTASLISNLEAYNEKLHGKKTKISTSDNKGLNKEGAIEALQDVTDGANETIRLSGEDENGNQLVGDNEAFSVRVMIEHLAGNALDKARGLYRSFREMTGDGVIRRPAVEEARVVAMADIVSGDGQA